MTTPNETRLTPVPFDTWDDETRATLLAHLRRPELYLSGAPEAPAMPIVMELFAHHVPLTETFMAFTDVLAGDRATLDPRLRELVILRVAWRTGSGYEWNQHARMGAEVGVTPRQLQSIPDGAAADAWSAEERALLTAVDEMIDRFEVSDDTWHQLADAFEAPQLFEILFLAGGYLCLAAVLNSVGLRGQIAPPESAD
jgi:alkylhydroperoxidase family enzyme